MCPECEASYSSGTYCLADGVALVRLTVADPLVGRELDGRFTIIEKLGYGGMGAVYRARQASVDREVAIKVIHPNLLADAAVIKRFLREARLASKLNHPNAVSVLDFGQTAEGMFYLVMELLTGRTLDQVIEEDGLFDARRVVKIGTQICDALEAAHAISIVHRDLKPENVMILDSGRDFVKVLDFGLAKSLEQDPAMDVTMSGILQGTPQYVPPERACGQSGDGRSDLYSLGCMLYLLATGALPFSAPSINDLLIKHVAERPPPMLGVPEVLSDVIFRLLAKRPQDRYASATETRTALEAVLDAVPRATSEADSGSLSPARGSRPISRPSPAAPPIRVHTLLPAPSLPPPLVTASPVCVVPILPAIAQVAPAASGPISGSADTLFAAAPPRWALLRHRARWPLAIAAVLTASLVVFFSTRKVESTAAPAPTASPPVSASASAEPEAVGPPSPSPSPAAFVAPEPAVPALDPSVTPAPPRSKSRSKRSATKRPRDSTYDLPF
jgi:serine/threonine-protein kinase